ncbi:tripartite motif-containing protein 16-like [Stegastes partitus]|uniref:Tripartite motif-containing protein 16-like n=1 Tax=Stegastes partitus TaxID=144197 RepID=A0A9Y4JIZ3_9TELE|nr:PREDICTED: tripartite motif-containing protein 16-like [Stegastes partitus]
MAQRGSKEYPQSFSCSVCRDLLKDPVITSCGHSFCLDCIEAHWNAEEGKRLHSCPQCRKTFIQRPVLEKNILLAELVEEELKRTELQAAAAAAADHGYAGAEDVACDVCTGRKRKAVMSCLVCPASYCENHLQPHYDSPPLKKHQLVEPSKNLQENICPRHGELMKMFCRTDQQLICHICSVDQHKGHEAVPTAAERTKKQEELEESRLKVCQRIQDREKDMKLLREELEAINVSADKTVEHSEEMFSQMIRLIQKRSSEVKQQIRSQQEKEVSRVQELEEKLQQEISDLKRKDAELKQHSETPDLRRFLHDYPSASALSESTHSSSISIRPRRHFEDVTAAVEELRDGLQDLLRDAGTNISLAITDVDVLLSEPTRAGFLKYSREITLDPNTANRFLLLSDGNRKVEVMDRPQPRPAHPDRFTPWQQVLSNEGLTGRCYWEVEMRGETNVAVAYKNISRTGSSSGFGLNDKSWALRCYSYICIFAHDTILTPGSGGAASRVGVYLDHRAGVLSFYNVSSDTMTLIHRVQTSFTQPLHAGVWLGSESSLEFIKAE